VTARDLLARAHALRLEALRLSREAFALEEEAKRLQYQEYGTARASGDDC